MLSNMRNCQTLKKSDVLIKHFETELILFVQRLKNVSWLTEWSLL